MTDWLWRMLVLTIVCLSADLADVSCPLVDVSNASFADCEGKVFKLIIILHCTLYWRVTLPPSRWCSASMIIHLCTTMIILLIDNVAVPVGRHQCQLGGAQTGVQTFSKRQVLIQNCAFWKILHSRFIFWNAGGLGWCIGKEAYLTR